jgi:hypothetical protein
MNNLLTSNRVKTFCCGLFLVVFCSISSHAQKKYPTICKVYFATDKYDLNAVSIHQLDSFVQQVNAATDYLIYVEANTDADGSNSYNDILSNNRASTVINYLTKNGIKISKTKAKANGELKPQFSNETDEGKAGNRRVDINTTLYKYENVADLFESESKKNNQVFSINNKKQTTIKAANGTEISIPADAFVFEDGSIATGNIQFEVKEALSTTDILLSGLSTKSDGKLLQTGGMVHIEASINGKKLLLAKNKNVDIKLPTKNAVAGMELFYGEKTKSGTINWKPTGQQPKSVELNIDKTALRKSKPKIEKISIPKIEFATSIYEPSKPATPYKPTNPKEPGYISFHPNWWQKIIYSDETKMKKELAINDPKNKEFDSRVERYEAAMVKYNNQLLIYKNVTIPQYEINKEAYDNVLSTRASVINSSFNNYARKVALQFITHRINAFLKNPVTNRTKLNLTDYRFNLNTCNPYEITVKAIGEHNIVPESVVKSDDMNRSVVLYEAYGNYYYPKNILFKNGSIINININNLVSQQILRLVDSLGLNNLVDDYNKKILEASAKAGALDNTQLNSYVYTVNKMDWINCDRFVENNNPVAINIKEEAEAKIFVVCHDVNGYLSAYKTDKNYIASMIPKNSNITIVSIKLEKGKILMASLKTKADGSKVITPEYQECSVAQMKDRLKKIDNNS